MIVEMKKKSIRLRIIRRGFGRFISVVLLYVHVYAENR